MVHNEVHVYICPWFTFIQLVLILKSIYNNIPKYIIIYQMVLVRRSVSVESLISKEL